MSGDHNTIVCQATKNSKDNCIPFALQYERGDVLSIRLKKNVTLKQICQNYRWLEVKNERTSDIGLIRMELFYEFCEEYNSSNSKWHPSISPTALKRYVGVEYPHYYNKHLSHKNVPFETDFYDDTYVKFIGCEVDVKSGSTTNAIYYCHNLVNVFFIKPIFCIHCEDYIWGTGRQGVSCLELYVKMY